MNPRRRIRRLAIVALCGPLAAAAQTTAERSARAVADSFFSAIAQQRWTSAAALLDLEAFAPILREAQSNARSMHAAPPMTAAQLMADDSTMPRAVAEWQVAKMNSARDAFGSPFAYGYARINSADELIALTPAEGAARWLEAQDERYLTGLAWKQAGCTTPLPPMPAPEEVVRAVALEDDSLAYVIHGPPRLVGQQFVPLIGNEVELARLRRVHGAWRVIPTVDRSTMSYGISIDPTSSGCGRPADSSAMRRSALSEMKLTLTAMRTAEEVFFVDSVRYTDRVSNLASITLPEDVTVKSLTVSPKGDGYQITVTSKRLPGSSCAMAVGNGVKNPLDEKAGDAAPICKTTP